MGALDQIALELNDLSVENSELSLGTSARGIDLDGEILGQSSRGGKEGEGFIEKVEDSAEVVRPASERLARRCGAMRRRLDVQVLHDRRASGGDREVGVTEDVLLREAPVTLEQGEENQR